MTKLPSFFAAGALALIALPAQALEQGWGFAAGLTGGVGTQYRCIREDGWGAGGAFAAWSAGTGTAFALGTSGLKVLAEHGPGRLYAVAGLGVGNPRFQDTDPVLFAAGAGLGMQLGRAPGVALAIEEQLTVVGSPTTGWNVVPMPTLSLTCYY